MDLSLSFTMTSFAPASAHFLVQSAWLALAPFAPHFESLTHPLTVSALAAETPTMRNRNANKLRTDSSFFIQNPPMIAAKPRLMLATSHPLGSFRCKENHATVDFDLSSFQIPYDANHTFELQRNYTIDRQGPKKLPGNLIFAPPYFQVFGRERSRGLHKPFPPAAHNATVPGPRAQSPQGRFSIPEFVLCIAGS